MGFCSKGLKKFETAVVNEPSIFEPLKFYCNLLSSFFTGTSNPMSRAPCPNKLKTETLDNSILKHMSENQGFRLGEIIRFVTGNVPSNATAMYHLFHRKLRKYVGNLKASGKIAADNRLLNRTQQVVVMQVRS